MRGRISYNKSSDHGRKGLPMKKRYLFFDIDGTLLVGGYGADCIPDSAKIALQTLRENGHFLAIATGRSQAMAYDIMKELGFENMVSDGGNGLTLNGKLLGEIEPLKKEDVLALIKECDEKGLPWAVSSDNSKTRIAPDTRFYDFTHDIYLNTKVVPGFKAEDQEVIYKMYVACRYPCENGLQALKRLPFCRYHDTYFFVEPTDKAKGIRRMLDILHADYSDAIVFGDSANDLSMFTDDWTKVAMGNAIPELKEKADFITTDVRDEGIYIACMELGLL